jgi:hypothetical protein
MEDDRTWWYGNVKICAKVFGSVLEASTSSPEVIHNTFELA